MHFLRSIQKNFHLTSYVQTIIIIIIIFIIITTIIFTITITIITITITTITIITTIISIQTKGAVLPSQATRGGRLF